MSLQKRKSRSLMIKLGSVLSLLFFHIGAVERNCILEEFTALG